MTYTSVDGAVLDLCNGFVQTQSCHTQGSHCIAKRSLLPKADNTAHVFVLTVLQESSQLVDTPFPPTRFLGFHLHQPP